MCCRKGFFVRRNTAPTPNQARLGLLRDLGRILRNFTWRVRIHSDFWENIYHIFHWRKSHQTSPFHTCRWKYLQIFMSGFLPCIAIIGETCTIRLHLCLKCILNEHYPGHFCPQNPIVLHPLPKSCIHTRQYYC